MHFTILVENERSTGDLRAEHGISMWLETGEAKVLFDTGASSAFAENADRLGIRIEEADALVLSHAHADHTGGLRTFFERNTHAPVFAGRGITTPRYSVRGGSTRFIGLDTELWAAHRDRIREVVDVAPVAPGVSVSVVPERPHPRPSGNRHLYRKADGELELDPFEEELFLWVEEPDGIRVVTGCSHSGIANIVEEASTHGAVRGVIGGFHLKGEEEGRVRDLARRLSDVRALYTGHCTGRAAFDILREELGEQVRYASTGFSGVA
ncbi:MAG: MBL fold metallo-hydrolase [Spirochaetota bacterium]